MEERGLRVERCLASLLKKVDGTYSVCHVVGGWRNAHLVCTTVSVRPGPGRVNCPEKEIRWDESRARRVDPVRVRGVMWMWRNSASDPFLSLPRGSRLPVKPLALTELLTEIVTGQFTCRLLSTLSTVSTRSLPRLVHILMMVLFLRFR